MLKYGQPFALSSVDRKYFLHSDTRSYNRAARRSRLQEVDLVDVYNHECDWVSTCLNPKFRLEAEGRPIPVRFYFFLVILSLLFSIIINFLLFN